MMGGMRKGEGFLTTWCMEADHALLTGGSWGGRTEVASAWEEFFEDHRG